MGDNGNLRRLDGMKFGELRVLRRERSIARNAAWLCRCSCGAKVVVRSDRLLAGKRTACLTDGHKVPPKYRYLKEHYPAEYTSWKGLRSRCHNPRVIRYTDYGGRGITVCERWNKFSAFMEDMGPKPTPAHTIERKDVNGNYEKDNCRWATKREQSRNTRRSVYVEYEGERVLLIDLVARLGVRNGLVRSRLLRGWNVADALLLKPDGRRRMIKHPKPGHGLTPSAEDLERWAAMPDAAEFLATLNKDPSK